METVTNPKLKGSSLIDAIPQTGECPVGCAECFYNGGRFYRTLDEPLIPSEEESVGKIVRVNSGHDSNIEKQMVLCETYWYKDKFYNTSIPNFDFPSPVVFTCNGRDLILTDDVENLMFVRFRVSTDNLEEADRAVEHYLVKHGIPVVMTFMRYYSDPPNQEDYEFRKSVINDYWCLKSDKVVEIMSRWGKKTPPVRGVRMCSTPYSSFCGDCKNCEFLYHEFFRRLDE